MGLDAENRGSRSLVVPTHQPTTKSTPSILTPSRYDHVRQQCSVPIGTPTYCEAAAGQNVHKETIMCMSVWIEKDAVAARSSYLPTNQPPEYRDRAHLTRFRHSRTTCSTPRGPLHCRNRARFRNDTWPTAPTAAAPPMAGSVVALTAQSSDWQTSAATHHETTSCAGRRAGATSQA